jgi:hypothetical protein
MRRNQIHNISSDGNWFKIIIIISNNQRQSIIFKIFWGFICKLCQGENHNHLSTNTKQALSEDTNYLGIFT